MRYFQPLSRLTALLIGCLLLALLPGCGDHWQPHTRREVLAYVEEQFPGEQAAVAKDFTNPLLDNGKPSPDRIWECWFPDLPDVVFHVGSRRPTGHPVPVIDYFLYHDRDQVFRNYYLEQYRAGVGSLSLWRAASDGDLEFQFSSMAGVPQAAEQLCAFYSWFEAQPHAGKPPYAGIALDGLALPSGYPVTSRIRLSTPAALTAVPRPSAYDAAGMEALCAGMLKAYYAFYRLPCPDFSQEALDAFARAEWDPAWTEGEERATVPHLSRDGRAVPAELFSGIGVLPCAGSGLEFSCLSYGGLFELLARMELEPEGAPEAFTVTGADGSRYEFSYGLTGTGESCACWYYKRDGELIQRCCSGAGGLPVLRVSSDEFQAITGLRFHKPGA